MALRGWQVQWLLLQTIAHDATGNSAAADEALERALDLASRDRLALPFLVHPVPEILERYADRVPGNADLISEIFMALSGETSVFTPGGSESLGEPLTDSEHRVLRYLPTNLSKREIASELYVSLNTVKTHVKHLYAKLDVQSRHQAVERGRELGLLARSRRYR